MAMTSVVGLLFAMTTEATFRSLAAFVMAALRLARDMLCTAATTALAFAASKPFFIKASVLVLMPPVPVVGEFEIALKTENSTFTGSFVDVAVCRIRPRALSDCPMATVATTVPPILVMTTCSEGSSISAAIASTSTCCCTASDRSPALVIPVNGIFRVTLRGPRVGALVGAGVGAGVGTEVGTGVGLLVGRGVGAGVG